MEYNEERNSQVRDLAMSFVRDKQLKAKLYREDSLTLAKMLDIVAQYHDKNALILVAETVQYLKGRGKHVSKQDGLQKPQGKCLEM